MKFKVGKYSKFTDYISKNNYGSGTNWNTDCYIKKYKEDITL